MVYISYSYVLILGHYIVIKKMEQANFPALFICKQYHTILSNVKNKKAIK